MKIEEILKLPVIETQTETWAFMDEGGIFDEVAGLVYYNLPDIKNTKIEQREHFRKMYDHQRGFYITALYYEGEPFCITINKGKHCDQQEHKILDENILRKALLHLMKNIKLDIEEQEEEGDSINLELDKGDYNSVTFIDDKPAREHYEYNNNFDDRW